MPARVVVVHDDAGILGDLVNALHRAGYDVAGFSETRAALAAVEAGGASN
jgi:DNA-binding NtrC family response regulator